jgi:hypothetical protein
MKCRTCHTRTLCMGLQSEGVLVADRRSLLERKALLHTHL